MLTSNASRIQSLISDYVNVSPSSVLTSMLTATSTQRRSLASFIWDDSRWRSSRHWHAPNTFVTRARFAGFLRCEGYGPAREFIVRRRNRPSESHSTKRKRQRRRAFAPWLRVTDLLPALVHRVTVTRRRFLCHRYPQSPTPRISRTLAGALNCKDCHLHRVSEVRR